MIQESDSPWGASHSTASECFVHTLEFSDAQHTVRQVFFENLGCSRSTPAAPHKAASLSQEVTLWPRVLSQCRRRMPNTFYPYQLRLRSPTRCAFVTDFAVSLSSDVPESVLHVSIVHLFVPSLGRRDHIWPSESGGNPRNTSPTGYEPKELASKDLATKSLRQFLEVLWKTSVYCTMYRENLENKINKLQLSKK